MACMLASLNVVRIAFSDWDCNRRSATRARRRLMGTRCSGRPSSESVGGATGAAALAADWPSALRASPLVMRPPRPLPSTDAGSMPLSARILLAAGEAIAAEDVDAATGAAGAAGAAGGALVQSDERRGEERGVRPG